MSCERANEASVAGEIEARNIVGVLPVEAGTLALAVCRSGSIPPAFMVGVHVCRVIGLAVVERPLPEGRTRSCWNHAWVESLLPTELIVEPMVSFDRPSPRRAELPSSGGPNARVLTLVKADEPIPDLDHPTSRLGRRVLGLARGADQRGARGALSALKS